jgi:putative DNA primase/helicase
VLEGVLAWAIAGAIKWYALGEAGLPELKTSVSIKAQHRGALDNVQTWLDEACLTGGEGFTSNSLLYLSYEKWCGENGVEKKKQKGFSQSLIRKNFQSTTVKREGKILRGFFGIGIS